MLASVDALCTTCESNPDAFLRAGVLPKDIEVLLDKRVGVAAAEGSQESNKVKRKMGTGERNRIQIEIEDMSDRISGAGVVQFTLHDPRPDLAASFHAIVQRCKKGAGQPATPALTPGGPTPRRTPPPPTCC